MTLAQSRFDPKEVVKQFALEKDGLYLEDSTKNTISTYDIRTTANSVFIARVAIARL